MVSARRAGDVRYADLAARLRDALAAGDAKAAEAVTDAAMAVGDDAVAVEARVVAPAMRMIGELWEQNIISVADEHLATAISQGLVARLFRHLLHGKHGRGRVMLAATQGEHHVLGLKMAGDVLEGAGYEVLFLGADVPLASLLEACTRHAPDVVGLTVNMPLNVPTLLWEIDQLAKLEPPPAVIVGGRALGPAVEHGLNASAVADIDDIVAVVERSMSHPVPALVASELAARIPGSGPLSSVGVEAIGATPDAFSRAALAAADAVRDSARHGHAMELLAYRDELTGLWNRRACDDRLQELTDEDRSRAAVLMLDVDRFKSINDTYGHEMGDAALVRVARAIEAAIRPTDLAARFGGDEFMVLLGSTTPETAMAVAERIRTAVAHTQEGEPRMSVSIGLTKAAQTSRATRLAADGALYEAKETGRDRIVMASQ